jgi:hypothetical protein
LFDRRGACYLLWVQFTRALAVLALLQGLLYCSLLPLWEGFDEPYHYGYVEHLGSEQEVPVAGRTVLPEETWQSMHLAPASYLNVRNVPDLIPFDAYFKMDAAARRDLRARLYTLSPELRTKQTGPYNYEAQQPPLAYVPLAAMQWVAPGGAIPWRVFRLRLFCVFASLALLIYAAARLGQSMGMNPAYLAAAVFLLLTTQNLYAAVAHVANDWLSVALIPLLFLAAERFWRKPEDRQTALFALALTAGLLAKSYFLIFVPFAFLLVLWGGRKQVWLFTGLVAALAGPWYARNLLLYDSLTGLQASVRAIPRAAIVQTILSTSWPRALAGMARGTLWNANSSFTSFSQTTLNVLLLLLAAGGAFWLLGIRHRRGTPAEWMLFGGSSVFAAVPIYAMVLASTGLGLVYSNANSWHSAGLLPGAFLLAMRGFSRGGRTGRWLARAALALNVYILALTYFAKLIPLYAGFDGRANIRFLSALYLHQRGELVARLSDAAMLSGGVVIALALATTVYTGILAYRLCRALD